MPEHSDLTPRKPTAPFVFIDPAVVERLQASLAASTAVAAAPRLADFQAKMATSFAGLASILPVPLSVLRPPVVASNAALANRLEDALDRHATFVVSTITSSVGPVAANVASIAKPRGLSLGAQVVVVLAAVVSTVVAVLSFIIR